MTLPGLDSNVYAHPALIPFGNDHCERYCDTCDTYPNPRYLPSNQLTNLNNLKNNYMNTNLGMNDHINDNMNHKTSFINGSHSFKSKLRTNEFEHLLKRRYSENVIGNLPTKPIINRKSTLPDYSSKSSFLDHFYLISSHFFLF